jgi:Tetracyclin repressor-like, C-terminal domain
VVVIRALVGDDPGALPQADRLVRRAEGLIPVFGRTYSASWICRSRQGVSRVGRRGSAFEPDHESTDSADRYVSAKEDLVLLMQEEAIRLPNDSVRTAPGWREGLEALYREAVQRDLAHPWVLDIPITGSPTTPSGAAWQDAGLQVLADTPLTHLEQVSVALLVTGQARWVGIVQAGYARVQRETGLNDAEVAAREDALFRLLVTADAYPHLRAAVTRGLPRPK